VTTIVISQPMYFPWVGLFEQIRLADYYVHYGDVQLTRGFYNRVQVKTSQGSKWLTVPLRDHHRGQHIDEALLDERNEWRSQHRDILRQTYLKAPFRDEMLALVDRVFTQSATTLADLSRTSIMELAKYFCLIEGRHFIDSKSLGFAGSSSQRLRDIVIGLRGNVYVTGHGARNYLDHELFENSDIKVRYMRYRCSPYLQQHGGFTPYVTALDLVANCGKLGTRYIQSEAIDWKEFMRSNDEQS
jgi:hypothetical protein